MIEVIVNRPSFEYDIHSLVKAFFPKEDVTVRVREDFIEETKLQMTVVFTDETVSMKLLADRNTAGTGRQGLSCFRRMRRF